MNGWCGRILRIDLTTGITRSETPPPELYRQNLGGRGLAGH
jgi:aldehyde:ferredoxin oxidoreductase